jgi:hypothetical protein
MSRRRWWLAVLVGAASASPVAALVVWWWAKQPDLPELTDEALQAAAATWQARGPASYDVAIRVEGPQPATYAVVVRDTVARSATRNGDPLKGQRTFGTWSVPGMLATIERDVRSRAEGRFGRLVLRAKFDQRLGIPLQYQRIEMRSGAHGALHWQVLRFQPIEGSD